MSGYFVFHFMLWWNGKELVKPVCGGEYCPLHVLDLRREIFILTTYNVCARYELRKQFLLYLLKHRENEAKGNFPDMVQEFFKRIIWILIFCNRC